MVNISGSCMAGHSMVIICSYGELWSMLGRKASRTLTWRKTFTARKALNKTNTLCKQLWCEKMTYAFLMRHTKIRFWNKIKVSKFWEFLILIFWVEWFIDRDFLRMEFAVKLTLFSGYCGQVVIISFKLYNIVCCNVKQDDAIIGEFFK